MADCEVSNVAPANTVTERAMARVAQSLGLEVQFYDGGDLVNTPMGFVVPGAYPNHIFVMRRPQSGSVRQRADIIATTFHEIAHQMRLQAPNQYEGIRTIVSGQLPEARRAIRRIYAKSQFESDRQKARNHEQIDEEAVAHILADAVRQSRGFVRAVDRQSPELVRAGVDQFDLRAVVREFIGARRSLYNSKTYGPMIDSESAEAPRQVDTRQQRSQLTGEQISELDNQAPHTTTDPSETRGPDEFNAADYGMGRAQEAFEEMLSRLRPTEGGNQWNPEVYHMFYGGGARNPTSVANDGIRGVATVFDETAPLHGYESGQDAVDVLDQAEQHKSNILGPNLVKLDEAFKALGGTSSNPFVRTRKRYLARQWLHAIRPDGLSNVRAAIEDHTVRDNPLQDAPEGIAELIPKLKQIVSDLGDEAETMRIQLRSANIPKGVRKFFKKAQGGSRMFRRMNEHGRRMFEDKTGADWDAFVQWFRDHPEYWPTETVDGERRRVDLSTEANIQKHMAEQEQQARRVIPKNVKLDPSLTHTRTFDVLPDALNINGREVRIMETDVQHLFAQAIESEARTVGFYRALSEYIADKKPFEIPMTPTQGGDSFDVDFDAVVNEWRQHIVKDVKDKGGNAESVKKAFDRSVDNFLRAFGQDLVGEILLVHPQSLIGQTATAIQRNVMASILNLVALYDILQPMGVLNRLLAKEYVQAMADFTIHRKKLIREFGVMDAVPRAYLDMRFHKDNPVFDAFGRFLPNFFLTPGRKSELWGQTITARAWQLWAQNIEWGQRQSKMTESILRNDMRFTEAQMRQLEDPNTTMEQREFLIAKIIRNGVKTTNFLAEDPHRRGLLSNRPTARFLFPFLSFPIGRMKQVFRTTERFIDALKTVRQARGQGGEELKRAWAYLLATFAAGLAAAAHILGEGAFQKYARRVATGQVKVNPFAEEFGRGFIQGDDPEGLAWYIDAFQEAGALGPIAHLTDAFRYSSGSSSGALINLVPRIAILSEAGFAVFGWGRYEDTPISRRIGDATQRINPLYRGVRRYIDQVAFPEKQRFFDVRSHLRKFIEERDKDVPASLRERAGFHEVPIPGSQDLYEAIRNDDEPETIKRLLDEYVQFMEDNGNTRKAALDKLRGSLDRKGPINARKATRAEFLKSLPREQRVDFTGIERRYNQRVDRWVPKGTGGSRRRRRRRRERR